MLDASEDRPVDEATLPKGKEGLPMLILYESNKHSIKEVMELTIKIFVKNDSLIIATDDHKDELMELDDNKCTILDLYSVSGIEAQWLVITGSDQDWTFELLSRGRNGLVILLDMSASLWYVKCVVIMFHEPCSCCFS